MLDYLRKEAQFHSGEEMMDVIRTPEDAVAAENGESAILK
jgi:hypothetical protein